MGTSFTDYRGHGFLTRDAALETVLALLVLELEPLARQDPDLDEILDSWTIQSVGGFIGCVSADLDEHLTSHPDLARRADRASVGQPWNAPGALATWTGNVADALRDLIAGCLPASDGGFWFVDGDGRHLRPTRQLRRPASYAALSIRSVTSRSCARNSRS